MSPTSSQPLHGFASIAKRPASLSDTAWEARRYLPGPETTRHRGAAFRFHRSRRQRRRVREHELLLECLRHRRSPCMASRVSRSAPPPCRTQPGRRGGTCQALKQRGIAVLRFDFTGLGGSEGEFANTNFSSNVSDIVAAPAWLREYREAPRLLVGHSLGGAAVLARP